MKTNEQEQHEVRPLDARGDEACVHTSAGTYEACALRKGEVIARVRATIKVKLTGEMV